MSDETKAALEEIHQGIGANEFGMDLDTQASRGDDILDEEREGVREGRGVDVNEKMSAEELARVVDVAVVDPKYETSFTRVKLANEFDLDIRAGTTRMVGPGATDGHALTHTGGNSTSQ